MTLREKIAAEIASRGPIPFSRYMEMCLYDPELGYYSRAKEQFGKAGDFYTSSDVHAVFGRLLARQFDEMWSVLGAPDVVDVVELGPGRGLFAQDVLEWAKKKFPDFHGALRYRLVEHSTGLRARLQERFAERIAAGRVSVHASVDELPASQATIVFANELFDALPVEVFDHRGELRVGSAANTFVEHFVPPRAELLEYVDRYSVHPGEGQRVEICLAAQEYVRRIAERVPRGFLVAIDYGYTRDEQLAGRHLDTLTTYTQHTLGHNPYEAPGEQDITTHVNFTAVSAAAQDAGLEFGALLTQSQFLIGIGESNEFADAFEDTRAPQERAKVLLQLKHLVTPAGMGETFHVLLMRKDLPKHALPRLSGLRFARLGL